MPAYTVQRQNLGSPRRAFYCHVVIGPNAQRVGDSFNDIGGEKPAQGLADLLDAAHQHGLAENWKLYCEARDQISEKDAMLVRLQFELGRAEAKLRAAGIEV